MIRILLEFIVNLAPANKKVRFVQTIQLDNILSAKHAYLKVKCKNTHNTEKISAKYKLQQSVSSGKKKITKQKSGATTKLIPEPYTYYSYYYKLTLKM